MSYVGHNVRRRTYLNNWNNKCILAPEVTKKNFILLFDIPRGSSNLQRKVNRKLHKANAEKIQHSVWKSKNLSDLMKIAQTIKQEGGRATILKEDIVAVY